MSSEGILASIAIAVLFGLWVFAPVLSYRNRQTTDTVLKEKQTERLMVYYEQSITNIRDLDNDFAVGKLGEAEYQADRQRWAQRGVVVLQALDELKGNKTVLKVKKQSDESLDDALDRAIEEAIASYAQREPQH